jgi:hypothetical protein
MHMIRRIAVAAAAALLLSAGAASAELATWNQERVATYAQELTVATRDLREALDAIGIQNFAQQNALYQPKDTVKLLHTAALGLAKALKDGKSREETMPRFKRIQTLRRDAEEDSRRADISEPVFAKVFPVAAALIKLQPYYVEPTVDEDLKE